MHQVSLRHTQFSKNLSAQGSALSKRRDLAWHKYLAALDLEAVRPRTARRFGSIRVESLRHPLASKPPTPTSLADLEAAWTSRTKYWARKLGRLRLDVEPIEDQLTRYRRVTWVLTAIPAFLSTVLFTLFTVFGRPDIGAIVAALLFLPIVSGAWLGYYLLQRRGRRYLAERDEFERAKERLQSVAAP